MGEPRAFIRFSICDILKRGIGPSSSHTLAPWRAAQACYATLRQGGWLPDLAAVSVTLHGSLAHVGRGHYTTVAIPLGLLNKEAMTFDIGSGLEAALGLRSVTEVGRLSELDYGGGQRVAYSLLFDTREAAGDEKMVFRFRWRTPDPGDGRPDSLTWYSYGGGSFGPSPRPRPLYDALTCLPFMYQGAGQLLALLHRRGCTLAEALFENELAFARYRRAHPDPAAAGLPTDEAGLLGYLKEIAQQMGELIYAGCTHRDDDPCYRILYARPRAKRLYRALIGDDDPAVVDRQSFFARIRRLAPALDAAAAIQLVGIFALALSEQNAALKNVVTAPTNGSCGTVPAVLYYYIIFHAGDAERAWLFGEGPAVGLNPILRFLLTAAAIGGLIKHNASISGGVGGCQAEVGTSAAMAAGALADLLSGGDPAVIFNAAQTALTAHLGTTCDPVGGLVEVPCIDRNLSAAVAAVAVAREMALLGREYTGAVPFDRTVQAMAEISAHMSDRYKETATGGLALAMREEVARRRPDLFPPGAAASPREGPRVVRAVAPGDGGNRQAAEPPGRPPAGGDPAVRLTGAPLMARPRGRRRGA